MSVVPIFNWVLATTLRASILVLAVLLFQRLMKARLSARWKYATWTPVLLALLIPAIPLLPHWEWPVAETNGTATNRTAANLDSSHLDSSVHADTSANKSSWNALAPTTTEDANPTPPSTFLRAPRNWQAIATVGWLVGAVCLNVVVSSSYLSALRRVRRRAISVGQEDLVHIQTLAHDVGLQCAPEVWQSPEVKAPAVCGVLRPKLLLTEDFFQNLPREESDFVLRHELLHVRRGDVLLNAILFVMLSLHWFNPLMWFAFFRAKADREAACDEDVLRAETPERRIAYGKVLLRMEADLPKSCFQLGFVGMAQRGKRLRERIQFISNPKPMAFSMKFLVLLGISVITILGVAKSAEPPSSSTGEEISSPQVTVNHDRKATNDDAAKQASEEAVAAANAWAKKKLKASRATQPPAWRGNPSLPFPNPLVTLTLLNVSVTDDELKHLAAFPKLKNLTLSGRQITDNGLENVIVLQDLEALALQGTAITDNGLKRLAKLKKLKRLNLNGAKLTGRGIRDLAALPKLRELALEGTPIQDESLEQLSELKEVRKLSLRNTKISDEGLRHLAKMPKLQELTLQSTPVTVEGLRQLATSQSLRAINCWGTDVTDEDVRSLEFLMPNCEIDKTLIE